MAKITRTSSGGLESVETPTEQIIARASNEITITDAKGRVIKLRKPGVLAQFRILEIVGAESAENRPYMSMVLPLIFVCEFDGEQVFQPSSKLQLEGLIERLGEEGLKAVIETTSEHWGTKGDAADKAVLDSLKK